MTYEQFRKTPAHHYLLVYKGNIVLEKLTINQRVAGSSPAGEPFSPSFSES